MLFLSDGEHCLFMGITYSLCFFSPLYKNKIKWGKKLYGLAGGVYLVFNVINFINDISCHLFGMLISLKRKYFPLFPPQKNLGPSLQEQGGSSGVGGSVFRIGVVKIRRMAVFGE